MPSRLGSGHAIPLWAQVAAVCVVTFGTTVVIGTQHAAIGAGISRVGLNPNCAIKGNISEHGQIYHLPGQEWYGATRIDPLRGERWFCSEDEARSAGWRRARR